MRYKFRFYNESTIMSYECGNNALQKLTLKRTFSVCHNQNMFFFIFQPLILEYYTLQTTIQTTLHHYQSHVAQKVVVVVLVCYQNHASLDAGSQSPENRRKAPCTCQGGGVSRVRRSCLAIIKLFDQSRIGTKRHSTCTEHA